MSRLVDVIHADTAADGEGVDRLRALMEDARAAGLDLDVTAIQLPADIEDDALRTSERA